MLNLIKNEYSYNSNFRKYVDDFCKRNMCSIDIAFKDDKFKRAFFRYTEV